MTDETTSEETTGTEPETIITEPSQDAPEPSAIEQELAREQKKGTERTEAEKAAFSLKKNAERAKELGIDISEVLGITPNAPKTDKDAPLTVGMYEQMQRDNSQKSAIQLAEGITDQHEKDLVIQYLKTRIVPSGDPQDDLRFARHAVNSIKNGQIVEELDRTTPASRFSSTAGAPPIKTQKEPELTPQEQLFTRPPFNMTPAEIISKRPQS